MAVKCLCRDGRPSPRPISTVYDGADRDLSDRPDQFGERSTSVSSTSTQWGRTVRRVRTGERPKPQGACRGRSLLDKCRQRVVGM
jgi:hypothetical protein